MVPFGAKGASTSWSEIPDDAARAAFEEAARETYARQWPLLEARVTQNYARMRENGVTIDENPPAGVMAALRESGKGVVSQWTAAATPAAQDAVNSLERAKP
jgi:TRAP-type transport system periplasmic protein